MEDKTAKIYYLPPLSTRVKQIGKAQQLLETHGFKVKVFESRQLSSGDRRALEQGGYSYPVVFLHGAEKGGNSILISTEQLESELSKTQSTTSVPISSPAKSITAPPIDLLGISPPGPPSIFSIRSDVNIDPSPPRRFVHIEDSPEEEIVSRAAPSTPAAPSLLHFGMMDTSPFEQSESITHILEEIDADNDTDTHLDFGFSPQDTSFHQQTSLLPQKAESSNGDRPRISSDSPTKAAPSDVQFRAFGDVKGTLSNLTSPQSNGLDSHTKLQNSQHTSVLSSPLDPRTEKLIWLFNGIKQYCESAEFKRAVNLLGKTADMVETQARSLWSYLGWSSSPAATSKNNPEISLIPPPDTDQTLTLLVIRTNWYGRDQYRFLRLESHAFVRLRTDNYEECERTSYEHLIAAQVSASTIKFRYIREETIAEIAYNFGDPEVARMIAEALKFLKGKGSVAVSYIGN